CTTLIIHIYLLLLFIPSLFSFPLLPPPPPSPPFPYTTLFRSHADQRSPEPRLSNPTNETSQSRPSWAAPTPAVGAVSARPRLARSEEHTSELQSPYDLVCRLLLEKKKKKNKTPRFTTTKSDYR